MPNKPASKRAKTAIANALRAGNGIGPNVPTGLARPIATGEAENAIMNPLASPPDVIFADEWGMVNCLPAKPHVEYNGSWVPGNNGANGTATATQQPGFPNTDRAMMVFKHPLRMNMTYMQNSPQNSGVQTTNTLAVVSYVAVYERQGAADQLQFPCDFIGNGSPQFFNPCYAKPANSTSVPTNTTGMPVCTWAAHGNYLYPGHDNRENLTQNTHGLWVDGSGAASTNTAASSLGSIWISLSFTPVAGAAHNFWVYVWDGEQFVPAKGPTGNQINIQLTSTNTANTWYNFNDTNTYCIAKSGYYAVKYLGNQGSAETNVTALLPGSMRICYTSGQTSDVWAHLAAPNIEANRDIMKRVKTISNTMLIHPGSPEANRAGLGTVVLCKGGDWDPVSDFINATGATTTQTTISGLPLLAGNFFNIVASTDDARDWDPRLGVYVFVPMGGLDDVSWKYVWKFGNQGAIGTYGFPIIPAEPWIIIAMSLPVLIAPNSQNTTATFTHTIAQYHSWETHSTTDWLPRFYPNVDWTVVRALVQMFAGPNINYAMDNPLHWAQIKDFIRRSVNFGRNILRAAPVGLLSQIHPLAPQFRDRTLGILDAAAPLLNPPTQ